MAVESPVDHGQARAAALAVLRCCLELVQAQHSAPGGALETAFDCIAAQSRVPAITQQLKTLAAHPAVRSLLEQTDQVFAARHLPCPWDTVLILPRTPAPRKAAPAPVQLVYRDPKELLQALRRPAVREPWVYTWLRHFALFSRDLKLQGAACSGLQRLGGTDAVRILTERLMDVWGVRALERATAALGRLAEDGGLLPVVATLFLDQRVYATKAALVLNATTTARPALLSQLLSSEYAFLQPDLVTAILRACDQSDCADVAAGAVLARMLPARPAWAVHVPPAPPDRCREAWAYAEARVPGITFILAQGAQVAPEAPPAGLPE